MLKQPKFESPFTVRKLLDDPTAKLEKPQDDDYAISKVPSESELINKAEYEKAEKNGGSFLKEGVLYVVYDNDLGGQKIKLPLEGVWIDLYKSKQRVLERGGNVYYLSGGGKQTIIPLEVCLSETKKRMELLPKIYSTIQQFFAKKILEGKIKNSTLNLYGSLKYKACGPDSDIDIQVTFDPYDSSIFNELKTYISQIIVSEIKVMLRFKNQDPYITDTLPYPDPEIE